MTSERKRFTAPKPTHNTRKPPQSAPTPKPRKAQPMKLWMPIVIPGSAARGSDGTMTCRHVHEDGHLVRCTVSSNRTHMYCPECGDELVLPSASFEGLHDLSVLVESDQPVRQIVLTRDIDHDLLPILVSSQNAHEVAVMTSFLDSHLGRSGLALAVAA